MTTVQPVVWQDSRHAPIASNDVLPGTAMQISTDSGNGLTTGSDDGLFAPDAGRLINVQIITASGTYTPTPGTKSIIVEGVGAGGGGGGCAAPPVGQASSGGPGCSGEYGKSRFTSGFSDGVPVTIGAPGQGGAGSNHGTQGGDTVFGSLMHLAGGAYGFTEGPQNAPNGTTSGGNFTPPGPRGNLVALDMDIPMGSVLVSDALGHVSQGGSTPLGRGGAGHQDEMAGMDARGYGAGGSGALAYSGGATYNGGNGAPGLIIVYEYA